jgi:hypothetical protein
LAFTNLLMVGWSAAALFRHVTDEELRDQRSG